ncbi:MAG TPA: glycosyltransferase family 4 protein [Humisphaera sp.]
MKIAVVTPSCVRTDGQGRVNWEFARRAASAGHAVTLVCRRVDPDLAAAPGITCAPLGRASVSRPAVVGELSFVRHADRTVRRLRDAGAIDAVVANGFVIREPHELNVCHFVHAAWLRAIDALPAGTAPRLRVAYHRWYTARNAAWERAAFTHARRVIAPSAGTRADLVAAGVPAAKIAVVHHGVDVDDFAPGPEPRGTLGLPERVPLALFVGDVRTPRKNLDTVLAALRSAPAWHLAVAGDARRSPFPALADRLGVGGRTLFLGFRRDVPRLMRACDALVCPSRYEPFGLVALEALASGLPVVASRATGAAELLNPTCGAVVDDPNDADGIARELERLAGHPDRRAEAGAAARRVALSHPWRGVADRHLELLDEACRPAASGAMDPV